MGLDVSRCGVSKVLNSARISEQKHTVFISCYWIRDILPKELLQKVTLIGGGDLRIIRRLSCFLIDGGIHLDASDRRGPKLILLRLDE